jgi:flavin reductase (DIM6/NTAB) family NADH-FMN oxidoreductase RutF
VSCVASHLGRDRPRRLRDADVAFECRLAQAIPIGADGKGVTLCLLTVVHVHISKRVSDADGFPDPHLMRAPARLGGQSYLSPESWTVVDLPRERPPAELALKRPNAGK